MDRQPPCYLTHHYQPMVLFTRANQRRLHVYSGARVLGSYELLHVNGGALRLHGAGHDGPIATPVILLRQPGVALEVVTAPADEWQQIRFDVIAQPRIRIEREATLKHPVGQTSRQLPAPAVWGLDLPLLVPPEHHQRCLAMIGYCLTLQLRFPRDHLRANARLAMWLADYVADLANLADEQTSTASSPPGCSALVADALHRLTLGMPHKAGIDTVARDLGVSRKTLYARFMAELGESPRQAHQRLRLERAGRFLASRDWPIADVAHACGYASVKAFTTAFRRHHGCTPRNWRLEQRR